MFLYKQDPTVEASFHFKEKVKVKEVLLENENSEPNR